MSKVKKSEREAYFEDLLTSTTIKYGSPDGSHINFIKCDHCERGCVGANPLYWKYALPYPYLHVAGHAADFKAD